MPYIKQDELKKLLNNFFRAGCIAGYGVDHEADMEQQENEAFEEYYKQIIFDRKQNEKRRHTTY
ncbi:hypothetical protein [Paenibacillus vulneris]|uniref:Uncharacterized protein n=1 Tax=Paenibacillus vulneris TaxID=1133364 RepID=A0ABW3UF19_9BACL